MSSGPKMSLPFARNLANHMLEILSPECDRIEIAGSIRRQKPEVGDIEIVLIPKPIYDLFGLPLYGADRIEAALHREGFELLKNGDHFKQARVSPRGQVNFDIFLTTPEQWGVIYTIRTGSADFSHWLVTPRQQGGALPSSLRVADGRIWSGKTALETPEEADVFRAAGLNWIPPMDRREGEWKRGEK